VGGGTTVHRWTESWALVFNASVGLLIKYCLRSIHLVLDIAQAHGVFSQTCCFNAFSMPESKLAHNFLANIFPLLFFHQKQFNRTAFKALFDQLKPTKDASRNAPQWLYARYFARCNIFAHVYVNVKKFRGWPWCTVHAFVLCQPVFLTVCYLCFVVQFSAKFPGSA